MYDHACKRSSSGTQEAKLDITDAELEVMKVLWASPGQSAADVHGKLYGTLKGEEMNRLSNGHDVLVDIDVQGAEQIREH